jgi:hypothetical protein
MNSAENQKDMSNTKWKMKGQSGGHIPLLPNDGTSSYKGVVVRKQSFGLTLDMGLHFSWKSGPLLQAIHGPDLGNALSKTVPGDVLYPRYLGTDEHGNWILSLRHHTREERLQEREEIFGKPVKVHVKNDENGRRRFFVKDDIPVSLVCEKEVYRNMKRAVKIAIRELKDGDTITCRIRPANQNMTKLRAIWLEWMPVRSSQQDASVENAFSIGERIKNLDDLNRLTMLKEAQSD